MGIILRTSIVLSLSITLALAKSSCISAISWGYLRVDLFGRAPDKSIWHKFYTGYDWQPEQFERVPSESTSCPSVSSWGSGRLDLVWVNESDGAMLHKWIDNGTWGPSWEDANDLGGGDIDLVGTLSWGENRLDIIGHAVNGSVLHKAWTGTDYFPPGKEWEDLGGNFSGFPSIGSWGEKRLDIVGISAVTSSLWHKSWDGTTWSDWEDLEGGPFTSNPAVSSWSSDRLDIWALDKHAGLNHKFWDGFKWNGWEKLGGKFTHTPRVVHWAEGKIDIVGRNADNNKYYLKSFDGQKWNPSVEGWYDLSGPYISEPGLILKARGQNFLYLFGIDSDSSLRMQIWSGYEWQPSTEETWPLGNVSKPYLKKNVGTFLPQTEQIVLGTEL
ncbi:hypothetical protein F5Y12DRAFT_751281 [Xylaria sp. FL1777]|nr:hypothetical protein F5Y12DRAFT_751281 [Xylaria sp. FL1777]